MSDLMLYGVLRMPFDMAMRGYLSQRQFYDRVQEAAGRLEAAEARLAEIDAATPPSPSTAPDGKLRPRYKADGNRVVREHGGLLAQTYIPAEAVYIANALNEQAERLSSRPAEVDERLQAIADAGVQLAGARQRRAERCERLGIPEVDDEGLPALPTAFVRIDMDDGSIWGQIQDEYWENEQQISLGIDDPLFTAEQYRQGQRDAVAADRARREDGWISVEDRLPAKDVDVLVYLPNNGDPLIEIDAWGEIYECPVSFSSHSICVGEGWGNNDFDEVSHWMPMPVAPSHTSNKEK